MARRSGIKLDEAGGNLAPASGRDTIAIAPGVTGVTGTTEDVMLDDTPIHRFYAAFARRDWRAMGECYADDVHFSDPVFDLHGDEARSMWRMLCERGSDLRVEASGIDADGSRGRAHWDAHYTFSGTGRLVHNRIDAEFLLRNGLIVRHVDRFDFWRWSRQALGAPGWLLGWGPLLREQVRRNARRSLDAFVARGSDVAR